MQIKRKIFMLTIVLVFSFFSLCLGAEDPRFIYDYPVNPNQTYFRTCNDSAPWSFPVDLTGTNGVFPGDWIVLRRLGAYKRGWAFSDTADDLVGVFSPTGYIKPNDLNTVNRIYYPISINKPFVTMETFNKCAVNQDDDPENLPTDIPQDFFIGSIALQVPSSARYLFLTPNDSKFSDNSDPNNDYMLRLTDEVIWDGGSPIDSKWDNKDNWDTDEVPRPDFGVTFDKDDTGLTIVSDIYHNVKYLRVTGSTLSFFDPLLETTLCDGSSIDFLIDDAGAISIHGGKLQSCSCWIGFNNVGSLSIYDGGSVIIDKGIAVGYNFATVGLLKVDGANSSLEAEEISIANMGSASVSITNGGLIDSYYNISIGGIGSGSVVVASNGKIQATNKIRIKKRGIITVDGGKVRAAGWIYVYEGGKIRGCNSGTVDTVVNAGGYVEAGCSVGKLVIEGDYIQEAGGTLKIEVGGYQQEDDYDVLEVTGDVTLEGTVQLNFINGFAPKKRDVFEFLLIGGTATGSFSDVVINGLQDGFQYDISIEKGVAKLTALNNGVPKSTVSPIIQLLLRDTDAGK